MPLEKVVLPPCPLPLLINNVLRPVLPAVSAHVLSQSNAQSNECPTRLHIGGSTDKDDSELKIDGQHEQGIMP